MLPREDNQARDAVQGLLPEVAFHTSMSSKKSVIFYRFVREFAFQKENLKSVLMASKVSTLHTVHTYSSHTSVRSLYSHGLDLLCELHIGATHFKLAIQAVIFPRGNITLISIALLMGFPNYFGHLFGIIQNVARHRP